MHTDLTVDTARQQYLDLIHRYLQERIDFAAFSRHLRSQWAEEREALWHNAWNTSARQRDREHASKARGELPRSEPDDPRRLPRMLDRLWTLLYSTDNEEPITNSVAELLAAYRCPGIISSEARFVDYPPFIAVFEHPLPENGDHWYPCTVEDIRLQLARLPEYDLRGICAVILAPPCREPRSAYGVYSRWHQSAGAFLRWRTPRTLPAVLIYSRQGAWDFKLRHQDDPGSMEHRYRMERSYGMQIDREGSATVCRWTAANGRKFVLEYILPHAVGRHIQYEQRWRSGAKRWLPSNIEKQFADAYATRFSRQWRE